ncbi:MAG: lipopolysaccharide biosynthesis protein [Ruminococcus flavefaciens]|nr:lipopolysaccharide biosynthesis protein [Ruminococcus flavefaciens]MCM1060034.1 lipopolysaccharide biosynthesis protein [Eubacterium sp.]
MNNSKNSVIKSLFFKFSERCGYQGIAFIVQLILARLLDPTDYGVLTLLTIFINVSQVFVQSGLNTALIQRKDVTEKDYSTVFYVSLTMAVFLYALLFFTAPFIGAFYDMPQLKNILRVLAINLLPGAFNSIQNAKIAREMRFKQLMYCTFGSVILSGIVGITMAYLGFGVWALVGQQLTNQIFVCLLMLIVVKWRPKPVFEFDRLKVLFGFGWKLLCSNLIDTIYKELQSLVIGKKYNSGTLGYYNRGKQFPELVVNNLNGAIQSVMLPALAQYQDDKEKMKSMMRRSIVTSTFIVFPIVMGLGVCADSLISLLLTDKWLPCVPYLRVCCFIYAFYPVHTANLQAINAQGRSDVFLKLEVIKKIYGLAILCITVFCFKSPLAIAMGSAFTTLISCFVNASPNKKLLNYSYAEQMKDIIPAMALSVVMGALVYGISFIGLTSWFTLIIQIVAGIVIYIMGAKLFHIESFEYILSIIKEIIGKKTKRGT